MITSELFSIDGNATTELAGWPRIIAADSRSRFYFVNTVTQLPVRYDPEARSAAVLGRLGSGPGEFQCALHLNVDSADNVSVFDGDMLRRTILDPEGRVIRLSNVWSGGRGIRASVALSGDRLAVVVPTTDSDAGLPIKILNASGDRIHALGSNGRNFDTRDELAHGRNLALRRAGGFWVVRAGEYVIEAWDDDLERLSEIVVNSGNFFPPSLTSEGRRLVVRDRVPDGCAIRGIWEERNGFLAVVFIRPVATAPPASAATRWELFSTIIELIDSNTGAVLSETRIPGEVVAAPRPGLIATYAEPGGVPKVTIWSVVVGS